MTSPAEPLIRHYLQILGLQRFLDEPGVEDVAVQEPGTVWVRSGSWTRYDAPEVDLLTLEEFAIVSGSLRRHEHGVHKPILDTELPDGQRLNVVAFPHVSPGTLSITIRKHEGKVAPPETIPDRYVTDGWNKYAVRSTTTDLDHLLALYDDDSRLVDFICGCAQARQNIVLAGATGSSKTTLLQTIASAFDHSLRIVTIEDARELKILQPNWVSLSFKRDDLADNVVNSEILAQASLRMHPDVVILGEMRGREAWTFVHDIFPTHPGTVISLHANSPKSALTRIIGLCKAHPAAASYDDTTLAKIVAAAIDVIIPLEQINKRFHWHPIWFRAAAQRDGKTALDLLDEAA